MTEATPRRRGWGFWVGFAAVTLLIAGVVSYLASSHPDGLDSATLEGCEVVETADGEELTGECIAQSATDHSLSESPLADYALQGGENTGGPAGIIGVIVTVAVAGGMFWLIARSRGARATTAWTPPAGTTSTATPPAADPPPAADG